MDKITFNVRAGREREYLDEVFSNGHLQVTAPLR